MPACLRSGIILLPPLLACGGAPPPEVEPTPVVVTVPESVYVTRVDTVTVREQVEDPRVAQLELQLAEKDAQIVAVQAKLDQTRQDVLRYINRVPSASTRAEAASAMAEAEVAVDRLQAAGRPELAEELADSRSLLGQSTEEFQRGNYGGALYLAGLARTTATATRARVTGIENAGSRSGERLFAIPVPYVVTGRVNLRDAPGTSGKLLTTLDVGTTLVASSWLGDWLHVTDETGREGWLIRQRVSRRNGS